MAEENIETARLVLKKISYRDITEIKREFTKEVTTYMSPAPHKNIVETLFVVRYFLKQWKKDTDRVYAICLKSTGEFLGLCGIHSLENNTPELGLWTKISSHGNAYGRESIGGLIFYAKTRGIKKLLYPVDKRNVPSKKIPIFYGGIKISEGEEVSKSGTMLFIETYEVLVK